MSLNVTLELPAEVEDKLRREIENLDVDLKETYALSLFQRGKLSHFELSRILGLNRFETDAFLNRHKAFERSLSAADLDADRRTLDSVLREKR